jgi:uncharacterized protein (DUF488 family)
MEYIRFLIITQKLEITDEFSRDHPMNNTLYTIGHSNHDIAVFLNLLQMHNISALGDVRSQPYSHYVPQYSYETLKAELAKRNISYVFLGKELGARSDNPACYHQGKVQYQRLAQESEFIQGLTRVQHGMERYRIALMCSEKDPIECHRAILITRQLAKNNIVINHIHADGTLETQQAMESRLLTLCKLPECDMFNNRAHFLAEAYKIQEERIAYLDETQKNIENQV